MAQRSEQISLHLNAYLNAHSSPPDAVLRELANETADLFPNETSLAIPPEQGTLMTLLTQMAGAASAIEIGTFTGYSSICIARGLAEGGKLICCDINDEWTSVARKYWEKADLADRIELRLGPAIKTLRSLPDAELFDLAFIDADKGGYLAYWREVVPRVRRGGVIMVDNTFSHGRVIDAGNDNPTVIAIRDFNDHAAADDRVDLVMIPIGDGLTVARKKLFPAGGHSVLGDGLVVTAPPRYRAPISGFSRTSRPVPVRRTRPFSITTPWLESLRPARAFCSTSRIVVPPEFICLIASNTVRSTFGARPIDGSSSMSSLGSSISARANSTSRCCPPDRLPAFCPAHPAIWGNRSKTAVSLRAVSARSDRMYPPSSTFSRTVMSRNRL